LNAEEEPEELDYPGQKNPEYLKKYGPRGVLHAWATDKFDETDDGIFGKRGKQKIENTGMLTRKRTETFDGVVLEKAIDWLDRSKEGPFFFAGSTPPQSTSFRTPRRSTSRWRSMRAAPRRMSSAPR